MAYLFTSESVSEGHPDKVSDQISDALLDEFLRCDPESKVACETLVTTGLTVCAGEVKTTGYVDVQGVARETIRKIGYTKAEYRFDADSCGVISAIHEQSPDINQGVDRKKAEDQGAGDQGMMFGYACNDMDNHMPMPVELSHIFLQELAAIRREGKQMKYLRPDSKSQVTIKYEDNGKPIAIDAIVISTQHDDFAEEKKMLEIIKKDIENILIPRVKKTLPKRVQKLFDAKYKLFVNPTGKFVIGGPHGDTGLTGRKIIVDTYGGKGAHGGGAFPEKTRQKWIVRQLTRCVILRKTLLRQGFVKKCWCKLHTPSALHSLSDCTSTRTERAKQRRMAKSYTMAKLQTSFQNWWICVRIGL
jgi:S-adenosylmethionine synthetase